MLSVWSCDPARALQRLEARGSRRPAPCGCWWSALRRRKSRAPCRRCAAARPSRPGPGLPRHAPSVKISTSWRSLTCQATSSRGSLKIMRSGVWSAISSVTSKRSRKGIEDFAHQHFGRRSARSDAECRGLARASPNRCRSPVRSAAPGRPAARRLRRGAANCCCWERRSPASGRIRRRSP